MRSKIIPLVTPALLAVLFSVLPIILNLVALCAFVIIEIVFVFRKKLIWQSLSRVGVFVSILFAAYITPVKYLDKQVNLSTLEYVSTEKRTYIKADSLNILMSSAHDEVDLGTGLTSIRNLLKRLEKQTGLKSRVLYCGTGASLLFGSHPMGIYFGDDT